MDGYDVNPRVRQDRILIRIGLIALGVRVLCAAAIMVYLAVTDSYLLFLDEQAYMQESRAALAGLTPDWNYSRTLAWIFEVTGPNTWIPRALNVLLGAAAPVVVYLIARDIADERVARLAAYATAFWPSLVLWSSLVLKDAAVVLAVLIFIWCGRRTVRGSWPAFLPTIAAAIAIEWLRNWTFVLCSIILVPVVVVSWFKRHRRRPQLLLPALVLIAMLGIIGVWRGQGFLGERMVAIVLSPSVISDFHEEGAGGETSFAEPPESESDVLKGTPRALLLNLVGPFPWQPSDAPARLLSIVESVLWYPVLLLAGIALFQIGLRRLADRWSLILFFVGGVVLAMGIYVINAGSALRLRAMIIPFVLALASVPVTRFLGARRQRELA